MAILMQVKSPSLDAVEVTNKEAVRKFLHSTYWAVYTNDPIFIPYWKTKVYDMINAGRQFVNLLETKPNFEYELIGMIRAMSGAIAFMNKLFSDNLECGLAIHEFSLSLLLQLAAFSGVYDSIKVHEGFSDPVYYIIVYFNEGLNLEAIVKDGVEAIKKAND